MDEYVKKFCNLKMNHRYVCSTSKLAGASLLLCYASYLRFKSMKLHDLVLG